MPVSVELWEGIGVRWMTASQSATSILLYAGQHHITGQLCRETRGEFGGCLIPLATAPRMVRHGQREEMTRHCRVPRPILRMAYRKIIL